MSVNASGFLKETIIKTVRKHKDEISFVLHGSNGWEKWFQVALAAELKCNGAKDVEIEKVNDFNLNKKNTNTRVDKHYKRAYIDIVFRMKDTIKGRLVAVEIKQGNSPKNIQQVLSGRRIPCHRRQRRGPGHSQTRRRSARRQCGGRE